MSVDPRETVRVLVAARKLIEDPNDWWDGSAEAAPGSNCAALAIETARGDLPIELETCAVSVLARAIGGSAEPLAAVYEFNDSHSHAEVLAAFDRAIENEQAREAEWTARPAAGVPDRLPVA